jgi:hypothetical protein
LLWAWSDQLLAHAGEHPVEELRLHDLGFVEGLGVRQRFPAIADRDPRAPFVKGACFAVE